MNEWLRKIATWLAVILLLWAGWGIWLDYRETERFEARRALTVALAQWQAIPGLVQDVAEVFRERAGETAQDGGEPEFQTIDEEVDYLIELIEEVEDKSNVLMVAVLNSGGDARCLSVAQEANRDAVKLQREFSDTPVGGDWEKVRSDQFRRERVKDHVTEHGSAETVDYLKQADDLLERIIQACDLS